MKKTRVDIHWANSVLGELGVCGRGNNRGDNAPTYSKSANIVRRATGNPLRSHPGKVPITNGHLMTRGSYTPQFGFKRDYTESHDQYATIITLSVGNCLGNWYSHCSSRKE